MIAHSRENRSSKLVERVSLSMSGNGACLREFREEAEARRKSHDGIHLKLNSGHVSDSDREGELHATNREWVSHRIVQCGKAVGVTVDESKGGWAPVIDFAQCREDQNRSDKRTCKTRKMGLRELNSLCCSINYEKAKEQEERIIAGKGWRKSQGDSTSSK